MLAIISTSDYLNKAGVIITFQHLMSAEDYLQQHVWLKGQQGRNAKQWNKEQATTSWLFPSHTIQAFDKAF